MKTPITKALSLCENIDVVGQDVSDEVPFDISIGLLAGRGIDMDAFQDGMGGVDFTNISGMITDQDKRTINRDPFEKQFDFVHISDFSLSLDTFNFHLGDLTGTQEKVGTTLNSNTSFKPLTIDFKGVPTDPEMLSVYEMLTKYGFDRLTFEMTAQSSMDEATDRFSGVSHFDLVDEMSVKSSYSGNGIGHFITAMRDVKDSDNMTDEETANVFSEISVDSLDLSLRDVAMIDKVLTIVADESGETPDMLKMKAKSLLMMGAIMAQNPSQMAVAGQASSAFSALLDEGGEVTISLNPDAPMSLETFSGMDLDNPKSIDLSGLGITIEHKK